MKHFIKRQAKKKKHWRKVTHGPKLYITSTAIDTEKELLRTAIEADQTGLVFGRLSYTNIFVGSEPPKYLVITKHLFNQLL